MIFQKWRLCIHFPLNLQGNLAEWICLFTNVGLRVRLFMVTVIATDYYSWISRFLITILSGFVFNITLFCFFFIILIIFVIKNGNFSIFSFLLVEESIVLSLYNLMMIILSLTLVLLSLASLLIILGPFSIYQSASSFLLTMQFSSSKMTIVHRNHLTSHHYIKLYC